MTIKLHHNPGEKAQIDFCDGIELVNPRTNEATKTHLFVTVLPFSKKAGYKNATFNVPKDLVHGAKVQKEIVLERN